MIDSILIVSNPDEVSPKKIRRALQALFNEDFESDKKAMNELIIERFYNMQEYPKVIVDKKLIDDYEKTVRSLELKLKKRPQVHSEHSGARSKPIKTRKKQKKDGSANPSTNNFAIRKLQLSQALQDFLGERELPRTQVVKQVWDYIKQNDLQNPNDRREILCDDKMKPIFGDKMTMFTLNKILSNHILGPADIAEVKTEVKIDPTENCGQTLE